MPVEYSNLLSAEKIIPIGAGTTTMSMPQIAARSKIVSLFKENACPQLIRHFMGPAARSIVMQQDFRNPETMCVLIFPNTHTYYLNKNGHHHSCAVFDDLDNHIKKAWLEIPTPEKQKEKLGLVISSRALKEFATNMDSEIPDKRFNKVFCSFLDML